MTAQKNDFLALIPPMPAEFAPEPVSACGTSGCADGWLYDAAGKSRRCPACEARAKAERLTLQYERAGVDGTLFHREWSEMHLEHESWQVAQAYGANIETVLGECINLILHGEVGRGKTQAGVLLAKDTLKAGSSALVVTWADWVDEVMADYSRKARTQAEHIADLATPDLLVLDDAGAAATRDGDVERKLFTRVIDARYKRKKPTVLTTNLAPSALLHALGERAFDRIQHACDWIMFDGPSYRAATESKRVTDSISRIRASVSGLKAN